MTPSRGRPKTSGLPQAQPQLMVPGAQLSGEIDDRLALGQELLDRPIEMVEEVLRGLKQEFYTWDEYNEALLRRSFDLPGPAEEYRGLVFAFGGTPDLPTRWRELHDDIQTKMRRLKSIQGRLGLYREHPDVVSPAPPPDDPAVLGTDVFVVHGHDGETKVNVARFLSKLLGRDPIILHEQPDRGRTIIEKFEDHAARAACAVVLLTRDDVGGPAGGDQQPRARQNVVLELGFFLGKLGRSRAIILYEAGVELPSDLHGVLYVPLDAAGAWRNTVARELEAAGLELNLRALL